MTPVTDEGPADTGVAGSLTRLSREDADLAGLVDAALASPLYDGVLDMVFMGVLARQVHLSWGELGPGSRWDKETGMGELPGLNAAAARYGPPDPPDQLAFPPEHWPILLRDGGHFTVLAHAWRVEGDETVFLLMLQGSPVRELETLRVPTSLLEPDWPDDEAG